MDIYSYARLSAGKKKLLLGQEGKVLEITHEGNRLIKLYHLNGFFVEVTLENGEEIDHTPYKRGFKMTKSDLALENAA